MTEVWRKTSRFYRQGKVMVSRLECGHEIKHGPKATRAAQRICPPCSEAIAPPVEEPGEMTRQDAVEALWTMIDRAAPYMDAETPPTRWRASHKLKLLYCSVATSKNPQHTPEAIKTIFRIIDQARRLWRDGYVADPWLDPPRLRGGQG